MAWVPSAPAVVCVGRELDVDCRPTASPRRCAGRPGRPRGSPTAARAGARVRDRNGGLDPLREVAVHPVGGADQELALERILGARCEVEDPRVLEEAADDRADAQVLGQAGHARRQAAEAAHDQVDRHSRLRGARTAAAQISGSSSWFILQTIRAGRPASWFAISRSISSTNLARMCSGATSSVRERRRPRTAGQEVEERDDVAA